LHSRRFSEPVTVHRTHADGTVHSTLITTTKEAYDALMEAGHALANPAWQAALDAIVRALLDPTPENVEAGRIAFDRLHHPHPSGSSQRAARNPGSSLVDTRHDGSSRMPLTAAIIRSCAVKAHLTMAGSRTDLLHRPAAKPAKHPSLKLRQSARPASERYRLHKLRVRRRGEMARAAQGGREARYLSARSLCPRTLSRLQCRASLCTSAGNVDNCPRLARRADPY
jgi:hypothetical protein